MARIKVRVMLSTFNGELYLAEQLESILDQQGIDLQLVIRDDGSTDRTLEILHQYQQLYPKKIVLLTGSNQGVPGSFFELLKLELEDFEYFAFSDQDDVWKNDKLARAVASLSCNSKNQPVMYCSSTTMVDENLNVIKVWPDQPGKGLSMYNALIENVAVGCTMVLNREAMQLIQRHMPDHLSGIIMHDWWIYLSVSSLGKVIFDPVPYILYRQHSSNVLGGQSDSGFSKWAQRLQRFIGAKNHYILSRQAEIFLSCFGHRLTSNQKRDIERFLQVRHKNVLLRCWYAIVVSPFYRQASIDSWIYRLVYIMGKI